MIRLATLRIRVDEVYKGSWDASGPILLEVTLPGDATANMLDRLKDESSAVFFLRNKGSEARALGWSERLAAVEDPFFRLVSSQGLIRLIDGVAYPPVDAEDSFLLQIEGKSIEAVEAQLSGAN